MNDRKKIKALPEHSVLRSRSSGRIWGIAIDRWGGKEHVTITELDNTGGPKRRREEQANARP